MIIQKNRRFLLTLNATLYLTLFVCFLTVVGYSLLPLGSSLQTNSIYPMVALAQKIYMFSDIVRGSANTLCWIVIFLIWREIKAKGLANYLSSLHYTMRLRQFLKSSNEGNWSYKKAISQSVIEIDNVGMNIAIKLPTTYADQAHLQQFEATIMNELTYRHPDYFFSSPMREKNILWVSGTKR